MKKVSLLLIIIIAFAAQSVQARIIASRSIGERTKAPTMWIVRTGISLNNAAGSAVGELKDQAQGWIDEGEYDGFGVGSKAGYELSVAFNKPIGSNGIFWGMELGLGTRGASLHSEYSYGSNSIENCHQSLLTWNAKYSPFTIGYRYNLTSSVSLDAHLGAFVSFDFAGSGKSKWDIGPKDDLEYEEDSTTIGNGDLEYFQRFDCGIQFGVGVWYKKFNFDITYQRGFINAYDFGSDRTEFYLSPDSKVFSSNLMLRVGYAF